jgi:hypothetical protein
MERIVSATLDNRTKNVNRRLCLSNRRVEWQSRSGSIALDEYADDVCVRTITVGTKREVADFLHAMMVGIDLFHSPDFPHPSRVTASGPDYVTGLHPTV